MNRLKYVFGINVPRHIPSNAAILGEYFPKETIQVSCKRHQSDTSLTKTSKHLLSRTKKIYDLRSLYNEERIKNETECSQERYKKTSLERIFPVEFIQKRCNATWCQTNKSSSDKCCAENNSEKHLASAKDIDSSEIEMLNETTGCLDEKESRSYAEMIASYNEVIHGSSSTGVLKDNLNSVAIHRVRRSPFSTASIVSLKVKNKPKCIKAGLNAFTQDATFSSEATTTRYHCRYDSKCSVNAFRENNNDFEKLTSSYATMIERYSNAMNIGLDTCGWSTNLVLKRNVSTKLNEIPVILLDSKSAKDKSTETTPNNRGETVNARLAKAKRTDLEVNDEDAWMTKVDDIIRDLKRITAKSETIETKSNDKWMLQSVTEPAHWLDRVVMAHKKRIRDRKSTMERTANTRANENVQFEDPPRNHVTQNTVNAVLATSIENSDASKQPPLVMTSKKPSNPIVDYIKRGSVNTNTKKNSSQTPTTAATNSTREPQIELRMTPSQNEAVVSINVDEVAAKTASARTEEQLSVIISSNRNKAGKTDASNTNARSDFGSMQISISENTVPVKQIEFSINGKPVSELKSIVARADKLDVVSSMDKVEIRIPSRDRASVASEKTKNLTNTASTSKPVLNLQIAAKFNEPRSWQPRNAEVKTDPPHIPPPVPPAQPTTPPKPNTPPSVPSKPPRTQNLFSPDTAKNAVAQDSTNNKTSMREAATSQATEIPNQRNVNVTNVTNVNETRKVTEAKPADVLSRTNNDASVPKGDTQSSATRDVPSTLQPNEAVFQSNANVPPSDRSRHPSMNNENSRDRVTPENKTPSNIIPWWSSEDSFKKIRKKGNTPKGASELRDILMPKSAEKTINLSPKSEQKLNSDVTPVKKEDFSDIKKKDMPVNAPKEVDPKETVKKKSTTDENTKTTDFPDPIINFVRVKSPHRWVPVKASGKSPKYATSRSATGDGRVVKRTKHRAKDNTHGGKSKTTQKDADNSVFTAGRSPKTVKFVTVVPQKANVGKKPETKSSSGKAITDDERKTQKAANLNFDPESKGDIEIEKLAAGQDVGSQIGKANVQHSNTVFKEEKDLGGGANRSADVSAKSTSSGNKFGLGSGKEEKRHGADGAEKNLPNKMVNEEQRIKEILKSMKPIEKRKDGTLIDYGVIVPSRKPAGKVRQIPRIRAKTPVNIPSKDSQQEKILEAEKVHSTKKQTLTESNIAIEQPKIVQPEKISSAKKIVDDRNKETKNDMKKIGEAERKMQAGKIGNANKEQKHSIATKEDNFAARKSASSTIKQIKTSASSTDKIVNTSSVNRSFKRPSTTVAEEAPLEGTISSHSLKTSSQKPGDANNIKSTSLERTKNNFPWKIPMQTAEKKDSKTALKSLEQKKAPSERTNVIPSKIGDKPVGKMNTPPLMGTINSSTSQKLASTATKSDISPFKESSTNRLGNATSKTGVAPLEGTINYRPPKNKDNQTKTINIKEEKKADPDEANQKGNDLLTFVTKKSSSSKGGGNTGSNSPVGIPTGPSGLPA